MTGETQHIYAINDTESSAKDQDKDFAFEHFTEKDGGEFNSSLLDTSEPCLHNGTESRSHFPSVKDKEPHSQREAVIRPQQAGKIDFKSLHNKPKFSSDGLWSSIKGNPQSPTGKSRVRDKNRRSGKGERSHHQLYRLSITNARSNPTIGIAYPQQKVTPPKKLEVSRGPISGSYRFHVPSIPEREAELQQEDLSFTQCFPEASSSLTSANYTSHPPAAARQNHSGKGQPPAGLPHKSPGTNGQLHYLEFQANGTKSWPSPEKSFPGANYGVSAQKPCPFPESGKASTHCLGSLPFQYPFQPLLDEAQDPFQDDTSSQDYMDVSLATNQVTHGAFGFLSSSRDWQEKTLSNGSYDNVAPEGRTYGLSSQPAHFLHSPAPGVQQQSPLPCYKGRNEHCGDLNGAISSSGAINQTPSTFQENQSVFPPSLHATSMPKTVSKGPSSLKDNGPSQRILTHGSSLRRNMPQNSLPQVHFQNKVYCGSPASSVSTGSVPFEKSVPTTDQAHPRLLQTWEGANKTFSPMDQNSAPYSNPVGSQFSFECQSSPEQRQHMPKNSRMPWQQIHLTSAMPSQNRIELSRQLTSQKFPFPLGAPEWQGGSNLQNGPPRYHSKKLLAGEGLVVQRRDPARQSCGSTNAFSCEGGKDAGSPACDSRSKPLFFSGNQTVPPATSRNSPNPTLALPPSALVAASPCPSPLPSPVPNAACSSTCSSLSPMSSSPANHSFEDSQLPAALTQAPFFHHPGHPTGSSKAFHPSDLLSSSSLHYHPSDSIKPFPFPLDAPKDEHLLKCLPEAQFHKPNVDMAKGCLDGFKGEPPPPPYSSHHLLANSLSSASLDQLDVLLTCRQCDQNYRNLSSFLEHRQFCGSHATFQGEMKDAPRGTDVRKQLPPESTKHAQARPGPSLSPDTHSHLLALNKPVNFLLDEEGKGEVKEDPLKGNIFNGLTTNSLPLTASDLEIDEAKLDSLITEALNGLGYQSDNPEIDSSFIDVFADEELTSVKGTGNGVAYKVKDGPALENKLKHAGKDEKPVNQLKAIYHYEEDHPSGEQAKSRTSGTQHVPKGRLAGKFTDQGNKRLEKSSIKELARSKAADQAMNDEVQPDKNVKLKVGRKGGSSSVTPVTITSPDSDKKQPRIISQDAHLTSEIRPSSPTPSPATKNSRLPRFSMKDVKKRKPRSSTWSKELIHKIVQQKNKLHKLHVKSDKNVQASAVTERLLSAAQDRKFGEYDYVSDSEDEGMGYAKLHGRKKLAFNGRPKRSFSRKRSGRGEAGKEKEPARTYSQKRDSQEHSRDPSNEAIKKDGAAARIRRRSSRSPTGSNHSTSLSSETGTSPPSTERVDSDNEKESVQNRRCPRSSEQITPLPRNPPILPDKETRKLSDKTKAGFSRGTRRFGSAKFLLTGSKTHQSNKSHISPAANMNEESAPETKEKQHHIKDTFGKSPIRLYCKEDEEEQTGATSHAAEIAKPVPEAQESTDLTMSSHKRPFAVYTEDPLAYHTEAFVPPSHIGADANAANVSTTYSTAGIRYLKEHGLCDDQKDYAAPVGCYNGDPVGMMLAIKGPGTYLSTDDTLYDHKDLPNHYDPNVFSKPPAMGSSHIDNMYLCQEDISTSSFEQKHSDFTPFASENQQTKVSSPLSFDSSSIFGELPVAEFDAPLYDSVSTSKDNYVTFGCNPPSKTMPFEQQYPPFLQEKDWSLMEDVSPILSEDIGQFHTLSVEKPLTKKFPDEGAITANQMSLPLSDRIGDYNVAFMSNIADDELEIKRLVTELESQLQTSKLNNEASGVHQKSEQHIGTQLRKATDQFSSIHMNQETENEKGLFLTDALENTNLLSTKVCVGQSIVNEKPTGPNIDGNLNHRDTWPGPVEFNSLESSMCTPAAEDSISVDHFCSRGTCEQFPEALKDGETAKESDSREMENDPPQVIPDSCMPDKLEAPIYTDHMIKSPAIVNDSMFPKTLEAAELNKHNILPSLPSKHGTDGFPEPGKMDKNFDDPPELESFSSRVLNLKSEFGFQEDRVPTLDLALSSHAKNDMDSEERPSDKAESSKVLKSTVNLKGDDNGAALFEETEESKDPAVYQTPGSSGKASNRKALLFNILSVSKETDCGTEKVLASQETAANPLQQLQLFVARTVKNNEEELMMPCFPILLSANPQPSNANVQSEQEEEGMGSLEGENSACFHACVEGNVPMEGEAEIPATTSEATGVFPEAGEQLESFSETDTYTAEQSTFANHELHNNVTELQHLVDECSETSDINICADGVPQEHNNLSPCSSATVTPLLGQVKKADQIVKEQEQDKNKATLAFKNHRQSYVSHSLFEKDTLGNALTETLKVSDAECSSWLDEASHDVQLSCTLKTKRIGSTNKQVGYKTQPPCSVSLGLASSLNPSEDLHQEHNLLHETNTYSVNAQIPEEGSGKKKQALDAVPCNEDSLASLPLQTSFSHHKYLQDSNNENVEFSDFSVQPSEEDKYGAPLLNTETQSSSFIVKRFTSDSAKNRICCPTQNPLEQGKWKDTHVFPPTLQCCDTTAPTPLDVIGSIHHCLAEDILNNFGQSEKEGLERPHVQQCPGDLTVSALERESPQKLQMNDCILSCVPPFDQKDIGERLPESTYAEQLCPLYKGNKTCTIKDMIITSQSMPLKDVHACQPTPETKDYSTQPTNLLPVGERDIEVNLNQEKELEKCHYNGNKHQNEPEALCNSFVIQQISTVVSTAFERTADSGPVDQEVHQFTEVPQMRPSDPSTNVDNRENNLKEAESVSHGAESNGGSRNCMLNNLDQEEESGMYKNFPNASRNGHPKEKKQSGLQVTCDICSASFRSKPGLTRHKAVKHQMKNDSTLLPSQTSKFSLNLLEKTSKMSKKVSRKSIKATAKEKVPNSQMPTSTVGPVSQKTCAGQEKEPNAQMQEVVSRVLSDLSVISLEMSHQLHHTDMLSKETRTKSHSSETGGLDESVTEEPGAREQPSKGGKGRRSQNKDPGGLNRNVEKKLSRKARRRKVKVFPNESEVNGSSDLDKNAIDGPSHVVSSRINSSLSNVIEDLTEPGSCISTEEQDRPRSPQQSHAAKQSPCLVTHPEEVGDWVVSCKETASQESLKVSVGCQNQMDVPRRGGKAQAKEKWASGLVKQVQKRLSKVCKEQHDDDDGTNVKERETEENALEESNHGNQSSAFRHPLSPARPDLPLESCDSETANKDPTKGTLENASEDNPCSAESKPWGKGELLQRKESCASDAAEPDLQSLFDDDMTFSQLFPRDNQFTQRKCTRVYGKRTKKPKPVTEANVRPVGAIDLFPIRLASDLSETSSFCVTRDDPCEYETISIDDALMLNMCHGSKPKGCDAISDASKNIALPPNYETTSQGKEVIDLEDDNMLTFLCQNNQMENIPNLNVWGSLEKEAENVPADEILFKTPTELENEHSIAETSPEPPELEEEPFNSKINEDPGSPEYHTIDIEMLNAKFKMQDMCFFGTCKDNPGRLDGSMMSFKQKPSQHSKHSKNKLEDGKAGKTRNDMNIKTKDKQYKCKVCFQWFLTLGELDFHKLTHNPSPPPTCYMCVQRKFSSREQLRDHLKEKHAKNKAGLWACGMCLKEISDVWMYNEHLREHATQFARKGQAQKSVMGLPTCFSEDNAAVTHFLNTIMYRKPSKSSKQVDSSSKHLASKENKSLKEPPPEQEAKVTKDALESSVKIKPPSSISSSSKGSASPPPDNMQKSEITQKAVPMHPDCKDPSRDCHHCGKQFPKPFKLQRHLVVHSLQKIYLCHKCPMFYQETKELRTHLSQDHGIAEEPEIKHTTLYACELCADVMHVIKKSFICSMCNYTFSKKEQYDRHMEKHLVGSNKTFKFRGVMRPGITSKDGNEKIKEESYPKEDMPPRKKRKIRHLGGVTPHPSSVRFDSSNDQRLADEPLPPRSEFFPETASDPGATLPQNSVKTEDLVGDFSDLLAEMEKSQFNALRPPPCLSPSLPQAAVSDPELSHVTALSIEELDKGAFDGKPLPFLDSSEFTVDLAHLACNQSTEGKVSLPPLTEKHGHADGQEEPTIGNQSEHAVGILDNPISQEEPVDEIPFLQLAKTIPELPASKIETLQAKDNQKTLWSNLNVDDTASRETASKPSYSEAAFHSLPLKDKTASPVLNRAAKDSTPPKKTTGSPGSGETPSAADGTLGSTEEIQKPCSLKEKVVPETGVCAKDSNNHASIREIGCSQNKPLNQLKAEGVANPVKYGHLDPGKSLDKQVLNGTSKLHPKKRKEHKSSSHKGNSASRENIEGDGKKKKARTLVPGRSNGAGEFKRAEWINNEASALSPGRRETHCNKLIPKPRMTGVGNHLKKMALDTYNQKKVTSRHSNGDLKCKKDILGKTFHHLLAKGTAPSLHSSLNRNRTVQGAKPADSHNYRTAESQNNLLSQLFGQKLTSFKIPLRRDTSE
ncbi:zinc finger protein 469 [Emydura macquarii macquarii]|uniref:zinc finger protein 469 n=1 Tax=Emydura macquarii macquarii TaxID=1129001 RepID=UPI00352B79F3